jgi:Protein of unknown function (DUF3866)
MLKLRRGRVASVESAGSRIAHVTVQLDGGGEARPAVAYPALTGPVELGDEVVVNVEAADLGLGSGGFDVVHCNLTRGLEGGGGEGHVMKLNYTALQHAVQPLEEGLDDPPPATGIPVAVLALHGQLPAAAFAVSQLAPGTRAGYVQTSGGALPGELSDTVADMLDRGMLAGHVSAGAAHGAPAEAITLEGALDAGARRLEWDCAFVGPGPGILGSASTLGHGGLVALASAHAALALGSPVAIVPRVSSGDPRERHRGLSHHTDTVLRMLLRPVRVAVPDGLSLPSGAALGRAVSRAGHEGVALDVSALCDPYLASGLPARTMGRSIDEDRDFFLAALAGGALLAQLVSGKEH